MDRKEKIQNLFEGLMALKKVIGTRRERFLKQTDLSSQQMHILYMLAHEDRLTVKDVAAMMGITSSAATQIIEGLVKSGYVERIRDNEDRRVVHLQFSAQGKTNFENFKKAHMERIGLAFEVLTDQELELLINIPTKILAHANQIEGEQT